MDFLNSLLPKIAPLGLWIYWLILLISLLESTAFIGLIIPGTTAVVFAGFLASRHIIDLGDSIWFVAIGGILGDGLSFYLGKKSHESSWFKKGRLLKEEHLKTGENFFRSHGDKSVLIARFIGPLRPIIPFVAGLFRMPRYRFLVYNIIGGVAAAIAYMLLGYFFGQVWHTYHRFFHRLEGGIIVVLLVAVGSYYFHKKILK